MAALGGTWTTIESSCHCCISPRSEPLVTGPPMHVQYIDFKSSHKHQLSFTIAYQVVVDGAVVRRQGKSNGDVSGREDATHRFDRLGL